LLCYYDKILNVQIGCAFWCNLSYSGKTPILLRITILNNMDISGFGGLLTTLRKQHHISQNELAAKLDIHRNTIGNWERGNYLPESKTLVMELAKHLHLNGQETRQLLDASLTETSPHWLMPYQRNPFFIGRDNMLQQLHRTLTHERRAVLSQSYALSGLGGIGKTQTAIEYAYRYVNDYTAVFWINAETNGGVFSSFSAIADVLNLPEKQDKEQSRVIAAVTRWLTGHSDWLVIFDNVEDLELVKSILPPARCGSLLFTSRRQALGFTTQTLNLEQMTLEEGMRFLLLRARLLDTMASLDQLAPEDRVLAEEIVVAMDGLPLALDQAGAYIESTQCSLADYLRLFQSSQVRLLDERDTHADHPLSVSRTFALAFERLEQTNPAAAELLTVCAFLAPDAIPEAFFLDGAAHLGPTFEVLATDPLLFNTVIKALLTYSLVQRNSTLQTLTVHRLVQVVLKERLSEVTQSVWTRRVLQAMKQIFPHDKSQADYWQFCEQLLPHALVCIVLSEQWYENEVPHIALISHVATYLSNRAHYVQAEPLYQRAVQIGENALGSEHPLVAEALHGLAHLYREQGKYEEAEPLLQRALVIRERTLGGEHPLVPETLNELAILYRHQGKYKDAEPLYKRALHIREQQLGSEHLDTASSLNDLAVLYRHQGKYKDAEPLYKRALRIREQQLGSEHLDTANSLNNLAILYQHQGKYGDAESLYQRALAICEQQLGSEHPYTAISLNNLATFYRHQGNYVQAEPLYQRVLSIRERLLGTDHPDTATSLCDLAILYHDQGNYVQAEPLYQQALRIRTQRLGAEHPETITAIYNLARLWDAQGKSQDARLLYKQALLGREQALGYNHPKTQETRKNYVTLLHVLSLHEEANLLGEAQDE
jgi:tetratricopeptide (TPR) repeat protein/DNA-binding XRE family transcriptional regulator